MLSPEEKKSLAFLKRYLLSNGVNYDEFDIEYEGPNYFTISPDDFSTAGWGSDSTHIPAKIQQVLYQFFIREIKPKLEDAYDNVNQDISTSGVRIQLDFRGNTSQIESFFWWSFYGASEETSEIYEYENYESVKTCMKDLQELNPNIQEARADYSGGGDSGYVEDTITTNEGNFSIPESCSDFIYEHLPSGWEINEGSQGIAEFVIPGNIEESYIEITYQENYEGESRTTLFEEDF